MFKNMAHSGIKSTLWADCGRLIAGERLERKLEPQFKRHYVPMHG